MHIFSSEDDDLLKLKDSGVLIDGIHDISEDQFIDNFVGKFKNSETRMSIQKCYFRIRSECKSNMINVVHWVDGSYVTSKMDPEDIDITNIIDYDEMNSLPEDAKKYIENVLNSRGRLKGIYLTHTFFVSSCSPEHPYYDIFRDLLVEYLKLWTSHTNKINGESTVIGTKGFIQMNIGDCTKAMSCISSVVNNATI